VLVRRENEALPPVTRTICIVLGRGEGDLKTKIMENLRQYLEKNEEKKVFYTVNAANIKERCWKKMLI